MYSKVFFHKWLLKLFLRLPIPSKKAPHKLNQQGFTLLEGLIVMIMIGVLSAIAAPSWLGFINRQRLNKANDAVLAALQEAQREAKRQKLTYSASFRLNQGVLEVAIYRAKQPNGESAVPSNWRRLVQDLDIKPGQILLGSNITNENSVTGAGNVIYTLQGANSATNKPMTITFDHFGMLDLQVRTRNEGLTQQQDTKLGGTKGLIIALAIPRANTNQPSNTKRCVAVKTLMGSMQTNKDSNCD